MSHPTPLFTDLLVIIAASLPVLFVFRRLGLPPIAGFVITGVLIGPYGLGLVRQMEHVQVAAEIGVVLLLFTIGLEVSLSRFLATSRRVYLVAIGQVLTTIALGAGIAWSLGVSPVAAILMGCVLSLSSSAIVLKGLSDRGEAESPLGRLVITTCLVQDMAVVPMLLAVGFVETGTASLGIVAITVLQVAALGGIVYLGAQVVLPRVIHRVMRIDTSEVVLLFTILVMLGTAWLTALAGLSLAIGAFAAGLILSETEYHPQIYSEVAPFRTLFASLFFISVGMFLDLQFVVSRPVTVLGVALGVLVVKTVVVWLLAEIAGLPARMGLQGGFYLAQIGEFAFVLLGMTGTASWLSEDQFQYVIASATLTMAITPLIMQWAPRLSWHVSERIPWRLGRGMEMAQDTVTIRPQPAVLVIGYGVNGRNVSRVLKESGIYHEILDSNPDMVHRARLEGERIHYGDVTRTEILRQLNVSDFDSVVLAISDPAATRRAVRLLRRLKPDVHLIIRTRYVSEVEELERLGANVVVPEEFETSLRIFSELLSRYRIPPHIIATQIELVRGHSYGILRSPTGSQVVENIEDLLVRRLVEPVVITSQSPALGKRMIELDLLKDEGCLVIGILRDGHPVRPPFAEVQLQVGDLIVLYGNHFDLDRAVRSLTHRIL